MTSGSVCPRSNKHGRGGEADERLGGPAAPIKPFPCPLCGATELDISEAEPVGRGDLSPAPDQELIACLTAGRELGLLGPMPIADQIRHSLGMVVGLTEAPRSVVDLGSGGGVPSLVLARLLWPDARWHLVEANARRAAFLNESLGTLGLGDRVEVVRSRAEDAGRDPALRHHHDLVLARSFGPPAVTAECAAPFVTVCGLVVISEPPEDRSAVRWPADGLRLLNLRIERIQADPVHAVTLRSTDACPDRYPRRAGIPSKRPLF